MQTLEHILGGGPVGIQTVADGLGVSPRTALRRLAAARERVVVGGKARAARYALRARLSGVPAALPVFEVLPRPARPRRLGVLHPVVGGGFWWEGLAPSAPSAWFDDLPWFLDSMRPGGFLGRQIPRRHPALDVPRDVRLWQSVHLLRYLTAHGDDAPGALVVGEAAFQSLLARVVAPPPPVASAARAEAWPARAEATLQLGPVGSSAVGEQPKFAAVVEGRGPVLVKYSPPRSGPVGERWADLLLAEFHVLDAIRASGRPAAEAEVVEAGDRVFLEVRRFDRDGEGGRRGVVSLQALDAAHVGRLRDWVDSAGALAGAGLLTAEEVSAIRWRHLVGRLVANADMHLGNLSFHLDGARLDGLTPSYDMLPMAYAPRGGEVWDPAFAPGPVGPAEAGVAASALDAARRAWRSIAGDGRVSDGFRATARSNAEVVARLASALSWLPG